MQSIAHSQRRRHFLLYGFVCTCLVCLIILFPHSEWQSHRLIPDPISGFVKSSHHEQKLGSSPNNHVYDVDEITQKPPTWLVATMSPAHAQRRRNIIRSTWQHLFQDPDIEMKFFLGNPGDLWMPLIRHENLTFGDLIVMPGVEETSEGAMHTKAFEFYKHIVQSGRSWKFLSKADDDTFLNAKQFYREYLLPHIEDEQRTQVPSRLVIGLPLTTVPHPFKAPAGMLGTMSWEVVLLLARLQSENPITDTHEDALIGQHLHQANEPYEFIALDETQAFDIDPNGPGFGITKERLVAHKMKDDEVYLEVAALYDANGLINQTVGREN